MDTVPPASESLRTFTYADEEEAKQGLDEISSILPHANTKPDAEPDTTGTGESLESKVTGKWFAVVGVLALLFGVGFFLKYAFENNWIGPTGRVMMGMVGGLALMVLGVREFRLHFLDRTDAGSG